MTLRQPGTRDRPERGSGRERAARRAAEVRRSAALSRILVPTDFLAGSAVALRRAARLPLAPGATIEVVHVLPGDLGTRQRAAAVASAEERLAGAQATLEREVARAGGKEVEVTTHVTAGDPFVEIVRCSRTFEAELVVIGRHGRRPVRDVFLGTTAERVIRHGDVPVLVAATDPAQPYRRPLLATALDDASTRTLGLALRIVDPGTREIVVVHAVHVPFEGIAAASARGRADWRTSYVQHARDGIDRLLRGWGDAGIAWKPVVRVGDAREVIVDAVNRHDADLVILGTHGRSGLAHALLGSVAEWVIAAAPADVLIARPARFTYQEP